MTSLELDNRIEKRIQESQRTYSLREQIAELIARNEEFNWVFNKDENTWALERDNRFDLKRFLIAWGISADWDGRRETLADSLLAYPEVFFRRWLTPEEEYIYIRIRSTTGKRDLVKLWPTIAKIQKEIYGFARREARTFGRDLCWYDLHKEEQLGKMTLGQIKIKWHSCFPSRQPPSRGVIEFAINRIKQRISLLTPLWG